MSLTAFTLVATPALAFLGVLVGHRLTRPSARELDRWRKREETMRLLRWGVDIALATAPLLDVDDGQLLFSVTAAVAVRSGTLTDQRGRPP